MSMIGNYRRVTREQLAMLQADTSAVPAFLYDEVPGPGEHLDVDKTWHAIHFLLNGTTWDGSGPLYDAVLGGTELGEEDVGYGPARFLTPDEVKATASALEGVRPSELLAKFDADQLTGNEIYPQHWTGGPEDLEYVGGRFGMIVAFFRAAAANDQAMLLYIN